MGEVWSRRRLVLAGIASGAGLAVAAMAPGQPQALRRCLATMVRDPASYRRFGLLYRRAHPAVADSAALQRQLGEPRGEEPFFLLGLSVPQRRRWFVERCRRDCAAGDVEAVEGWLLAASEIRLAVLLAG